MTIRSLEIFECVARHGKMSDAANELYIAQPSVSKAIMQLEKEYGVQLFDRLSKKLFITEAGKQLLAYAQNILRMTREMEKSMINMSNHKTILMGATMTVGKCVLVDIVKSFEERCPHTQIKVTVDNTTVIEELLLNSKLDIALVEGHIKSTELTMTHAISDSLVLVCPVEHPLASMNSVDIHELISYPFILREEGSGTRESFMNELESRGVQINIKWSCHGFDALLEAVLANQGLTVISKRIVEPYVSENKLRIVPINGVEINRSFSLVHHKTKYINDTLKNLMNLVLYQ